MLKKVKETNTTKTEVKLESADRYTIPLCDTKLSKRKEVSNRACSFDSPELYGMNRKLTFCFKSDKYESEEGKRS